jgi:hypothetical protein
VTHNPGVVTSAAESPDFSGVVVWLSSKAPPTALAGLKARSTVPIVSSWTEDPVNLGGTGEEATKTSNIPERATVDAHRAADFAPWYGGGLLHARGVTGSKCSSGVALTAGDVHFYMSMASHCGTGTWAAYDTGTVMGYVKPDHWNHNLDFQIVETSNAARIWTGPWNTTASRTVKGIVFIQTDDEVVLSGGADGNSDVQVVRYRGVHWAGEGPAAGYTVGPGFITTSKNQSNTGWFQIGDSGSPVIRSDSQGYFYVAGFISKSYDPAKLNCSPNRHPGFNGPCYSGMRAVYADWAINSIVGLDLKTG